MVEAIIHIIVVVFNMSSRFYSHFNIHSRLWGGDGSEEGGDSGSFSTSTMLKLILKNKMINKILCKNAIFRASKYAFVADFKTDAFFNLL